MESSENKNRKFKQTYAQEIKLLKNKIITYNNFPKQGIHFADLFPLYNDAHTFHLCIDLLSKKCKSYDISAIVALEARGFIIGAPLAYTLHKKFVPIRKPGKTPGPLYSVQYKKEYGSDSFEIEQNALQKNEKVLIVDDIIATGGSAQAAIELVEKAQALPVAFITLLQIQNIKNENNLSIPTFILMD